MSGLARDPFVSTSAVRPARTAAAAQNGLKIARAGAQDGHQDRLKRKGADHGRQYLAKTRAVWKDRTDDRGGGVEQGGRPCRNQPSPGSLVQHRERAVNMGRANNRPSRPPWPGRWRRSGPGSADVMQSKRPLANGRCRGSEKLFDRPWALADRRCQRLLGPMTFDFASPADGDYAYLLKVVSICQKSRSLSDGGACRTS